jgi:hypothetical protein
VTDSRQERVIIRTRFWPRLLRWAVGLQLCFALLVGLGVVLRGLNGRPLSSPGEAEALAGLSAVFAVIALLISVRRRNLGRAEITPAGIRPFNRAGRWDRRYPWSMVETVRVKAGLLGNRWLEVCPTGEPYFNLTAYPANTAEVVDALERLAGPDHPLTRAVWATSGEG